MTNTTTCTYIGTGKGCTCTTMPGSSYCHEHHYTVYRQGSGRTRRKDTAQAQRVRLVEQLMHEAIEQLTAEGFDCYGDMTDTVLLDDSAIRLEDTMDMMD